MAKIKQTVRDSPLFILGDVLPKAGAFLLLPFLTSYLSPNELGTALFCVVIASFLATIFSLNIQSTVIRFSTDDIKNFSFLKKLFSTITIFLILSTVIVNFINIILTIFLENQTVFKIDYKLFFFTILLASVISPYEIYQRILIVSKNTKKYLFNQFTNFFIYSITLFTLIFLNFSYYSIIIASILSYFIFYILLILQKNISLFKGFDKNVAKQIFSYSIKLVPNRMIALLPNVFDRVILSLISFSNIALYSVGYRLGESSSYLSSGFFKTYPRWLFLSLKKYDENLNKIKRVYFCIFIISLSVACSFSIISEDFVKFYLDKRYHEAWVIVPLIAFTIFFNNLRIFWMNFILFDKNKAYLVFISTAIFSIFSIVIMILTYKTYGIIGIAFSILIARFFSLITTIIVVKKLNFYIFGSHYIFYSLIVMCFIFAIYFLKFNILFKFILIVIFGIIIIYYIKNY